MRFIKEKTLELVNAKTLAAFLGLASVAIVTPFHIHTQWVTGPIVNAILIISLFLVGARSALVLCLIPSLVALSGGLLPAVMAPAVPFIMLGNVILVLTVDWFYHKIKDGDKGYWLGVIFGASAKFAFLFFSVDFISRLLIKQELGVKVAQMMSWPQLYTALAGGLVAYGALKWSKRI